MGIAPLLPPLSTGSLDFTNTPVSGGLITEAPTSPAAESTTSAAGNAGSLPVTSSTSTAGDVTGTSASSSAAAATSGAADFNCASVDGTTATDGEGVAYNLRCGDSSAPALNVYWDQANVGYTSCFAACDNFPGCVAFTYAPNAVGLGYCYLKGEPGNPTTGSPSTVFGVKASYVAPSSSAAAPGSPTSETATASTGSTETTGVDTPPSATSATGSASAAATTDAGPQPTFVPTGTLAPIPLPTSPVACNFGDPDDYDEDDSYCEIDLPFQMQMFSMSDTKAFPPPTA
ncbi:hypothetical protein H2203_002788 [Taxawa tesnikishii (nom. ined.)]|nr:hypothetical protein H2203_002788 [Dothideales sp. JES 119]